MAGARALLRLLSNAGRERGYTLVEIMVVLSIIGLLLTLVSPRYFTNVSKAREATLRHNLATLRTAIDQHYADSGRYPESLDALVHKKYIRAVPVDPITGSTATWTVIAPGERGPGAVYDVRSGSADGGGDGIAYAAW